MRTIAIAATIALITGGGVAGIIVGGTGAKIARDHAASAGVQSNTATVAMTHPARSVAPSPTPAQLRLEHESATPDASPIPVHLDVALPEQTAIGTRAYPEPMTGHPLLAAPPQPAQAPRSEVRAPASGEHTATTHAPTPVRVVTRAPAGTTGTAAHISAATTVRPQQPLPSAVHGRPTRRTGSTEQANTNRHPAPQTAVTPVLDQTGVSAGVSTQPTAGVSLPAPEPVPLEATHRTTMSQAGETAPASEPPQPGVPAGPATTPPPIETPQASSPPPVGEQPSALLANP